MKYFVRTNHAPDAEDLRLVWIADEHDGVVRLNDGAGQASFLH